MKGKGSRGPWWLSHHAIAEKWHMAPWELAAALKDPEKRTWYWRELAIENARAKARKSVKRIQDA